MAPGTRNALVTFSALRYQSHTLSYKHELHPVDTVTFIGFCTTLLRVVQKARVLMLFSQLHTPAIGNSAAQWRVYESQLFYASALPRFPVERFFTFSPSEFL